MTASEAAPYALLLFGGRLEPRPLQGSLVIDGWISFSAHARVAVLITALREKLDALLEAKAADPGVDLEGGSVVKMILRLLLHDGLV